MTNTSETTAVYLGWKDKPVSREILEILRGSFQIVYAKDFRFGDTPDQETMASLRPDFLFSFGPVIVKKILLDSVKKAAINFHTGPPRWPGRGSCSFALYEGDQEFGVTSHLMAEKVDAGSILRVLVFPILAQDTCEILHERALKKIPELVRLTLEDLKSNRWKPLLGVEKWERPAMKFEDMFRLMEIREQDNEEIVWRKIRAFANSKKAGPYIKRAEHLFWYHHEISEEAL